MNVHHSRPLAVSRIHVDELVHRNWLPPRLLMSAIGVVALVSNAMGADEFSQTDATGTLRKVVGFYRSHVGYEGAYLWRYSADLSMQEGEGKATKTSGWTQPPGSPSVGDAYLKSWRISRDQNCLEAAREVAYALVRAQLLSGGWSSHFDLAPQGAQQYAYRFNQGQNEGQVRKRNHSTFDDNKSQSALSFLMRVDEALEFRDERIHEAVEYALQKMLAVQYPNGAWPQQFADPPDPEQFPVLRASYPDQWSRTYPKQDYRGFYTLNDNNMSDIINMLLEAHRIYQRDDCFQAAERTGDFFMLAQMPDPQPGWAQQYDLNMHPAWARKFEPASITGGESQAVMRTLLQLYRYTGKKKFLQPLPKALAYYRGSQLPNGQLARFYELQTNKPLYFTRDYVLTYSDADTPTHYGFKVSSKLDSIQRQYDQVSGMKPADLKPRFQHARPTELNKSIIKQAAEVASRLDQRGAWVETGNMETYEGVREIIDMRTFIQNIEVLARYVGAE